MIHKFEINSEEDIILAVKNWIHLNFLNITTFEDLCSWNFDLEIGDKSLVLKSLYHTTFIPIDNMTQKKAITFRNEINKIIKKQTIKFALKKCWIR